MDSASASVGIITADIPVSESRVTTNGMFLCERFFVKSITQPSAQAIGLIPFPVFIAFSNSST